MKKLIMMIVCLGFLVLPLSVSADCEHFYDDLAGQCFVTTVDETEFELCFSISPFGPCPCGVASLEYFDVQYIDDVLYEALVSFDLQYWTTSDYVMIEGLCFFLVEDRLILMPENPLIFEMLQK